VVNTYRGPNRGGGAGGGVCGVEMLELDIWATAAYQVQDRAVFRKYEKGEHECV